MVRSAIIYVASFIILFIVEIFFTQKIYSKNHFFQLLVIAILFPTLVYFISVKVDRLLTINCSLLLFYYFITLLTIKKTYNAINTFLISKKIIRAEYSGKDFTYVHWDGDVPTIGDWWDEKLSSKPSWLDQILTLSLLLLPMILIMLFYTIVRSGS